MRALLLVNPKATSASAGTREVIGRALGSELDLDIAETRHRGHGATLARHSVTHGYNLVVALGGDGTVNEAANGLLTCSPRATERPSLAVIPGGNANVFARALGIPRDPVEATSSVLRAVRQGSSRTVSMGRADDRYFTFCAGMGLDAEVIRAVEGLRASGLRSSPALYVGTAIRHYTAVTDRHHPALRLERPDAPPLGHIFLGVVSNTTPWTYLGDRAVTPSPDASFDTDLDLLLLRVLNPVTTINDVRQFLSRNDEHPRGRHAVSLHDLPEFTLTASRPIAFQVDGDYLGEREKVTFRSAPRALTVVCEATHASLRTELRAHSTKRAVGEAE